MGLWIGFGKGTSFEVVRFGISSRQNHGHESLRLFPGLPIDVLDCIVAVCVGPFIAEVRSVVSRMRLDGWLNRLSSNSIRQSWYKMGPCRL